MLAAISSAIHFENGTASDGGPLETKNRNRLQLFLVKEMIGHEPSGEELDTWISQYGKVVSDIIDNPGNVEIRALARAGSYVEATKEVLALMPSTGEKRIAA